MGYLPAEDRRGWILNRLAELVEARGHEPFLASPVVLPTDRFFPDRWTEDGDGVWRLAKRLMRYAGLDELEPVIAIASREEMESDTAVAYFHGIEEGKCFFTACLELVDDPMLLAATLAHEVCHAYRHHHGLVRDDTDTEESLTDLTTVFLGFGVMTLNASYRYRATGWIEGNMTVTQWSHSRLGYLPPAELAYALALQLVIRKTDGGARRKMGSFLETNQAAYLSSDVRKLRSQREGLIARLGLPAERRWPVEKKLDAFLGPLKGAPQVEWDATQEEEKDESEPPLFHAKKPVFRVRKGRGAIGAILAGVLCLVAFPLIQVAITDVGLVVVVLGSMAFLVLGYHLGSKKAYYLCSNMDCEHVIPADAEKCRWCGGTVVGEIKRPEDRLAAQEEWEEKRRKQTSRFPAEGER